MRAHEPLSFLWENVMASAIQLWVLTARMLKWLKQVMLEVLSLIFTMWDVNKNNRH